MSDKIFTVDDYIPMEFWGKDHWSTLMYVETVMVDCQGFQIGRDPRMKSNRRNFRVMGEECPNPKRSGKSVAGMAICMRPEHSTVLNNGQRVDGHDDWACLQDMAVLGLFDKTDFEPGDIIQLSTKGQGICASLRAYRANGGKLADFKYKE